MESKGKTTEPDDKSAQNQQKLESSERIGFKESEYRERKSIPKYEMFKWIEKLAKEAASANSMLEVFVLCSGLLYGEGENIFYDFFMEAWLQNPSELTIIGNGKNHLPTIHIRDLAEFVRFSIHKTPKPLESDQPTKFQYIFAVDHSEDQTLERIVKAISQGVGTGKVKYKESEEAILEDNYDFLTVDLKLVPSVFPEEEEKEVPEDPKDEKSPRKKGVRFVWWCREGLIPNISQVKREFNTARLLKPKKIFLTGPPACGKSSFASQISRIYNIPHLTVQGVIEEARKLEANHEIIQKIKTAEAELRAIEKEKYDIEREKLIKKRAKTIPPPKEDHEVEFI